MPGSGVSSNSIHQILIKLAPWNLQEIHMSGGGWELGRSEWRKSGFGMGVSKEREWDVWTSSYERIQAVRKSLDSMRRVK
jgi:copper homeostasis protein